MSFREEVGVNALISIKQSTKLRMKLNYLKNLDHFTGLRHVYASMLASSGKVDLYTLQKLLTHKSPVMTQRYAHLRDETLKKASNLAGEIVAKIETTKKELKKD